MRLPRTAIAAILACLAAAAVSAPAGARDWRLIKDESELTFHGEMMGVSVVGYFTRFDAEITFDPENLPASSVLVKVDMRAVDTRHGERDTALKLPEWFDAQKFPVALFSATDFRRLGETSYEARGRLTIKGISREIILPFTLNIEGDKAVMSGSLPLVRSDFNIGTGDWADDKLVAFGIRVDVTVSAAAISP